MERINLPPREEVVEAPLFKILLSIVSFLVVLVLRVTAAGPQMPKTLVAGTLPLQLEKL